MKIDFDRFIDHHANYYDPEGNLLYFGEEVCPPNFSKKIIINKSMLERMKDLASELSSGVPFLRTDFYSVDGKIYFGELTFYSASGFGKFTCEEADKLLGNWIQIGGSEYVIILRDIIAYLNNNAQVASLKDFKIQCFNGRADNIMVCTDRTNGGPFFYYFDREWNYLPYSKQTNTKFHEFETLRPQNLDEMVLISEELSKGMPELRVDLYEINNKVYFGELTFFTSSGFDLTITHYADVILGSKLELDRKH